MIPRLPYPSIARIAAGGIAVSEEYVIPVAERPRVFTAMYPFCPIPGLHVRLLDVVAGKSFQAGDFIVVREDGENFLASPFFYENGGTVFDWLPEEFASV